MTKVFVRVDAQRAGPTALGILVPPGKRTLAILRPRPLTWDLLPALWDLRTAPKFCTFTRDEAAGVAKRCIGELENSVRSASSPVITTSDANGTCFQVWVYVQELVWIVCRRNPGATYQPALFANQAEADHEARQLEAIFFPPTGSVQEYYFNTQQFKDM